MLVTRILNTSVTTKFAKNVQIFTRHMATGNIQQEPPRLEKTINNVQLLGRVGADPQRKGNDEHPVAVFSLATHTNYRYESGEFLQRTEWHRIVCFKPGIRESVLNYLKKGQRVYVSGRITYGEIRDGDGTPKATTAVAADDVIFFQSSDNNK
ncbi:single-stranded DNA-binding protein, mitochondrial [Cylas formicarius]|uniref:single-stranded DNA-binding protein, mitochondrial n=1 Tax=Cylas formicarius TaxID=197179 RepID=UPI0029588E34|nr:single-stranded DNA-binding protein, mitochondrial [Cylas formicarius]